ncbi:metalloregulator ArsR/SmtB family transcription factor [Pseudodesulfovibrio cashew]|uniref:Metalloregulator ArsR/SmtB family transcription factor n=1 Tax=Pseudodesulfovibrio cashew TaxID=2678688 RepID=A0A6I6JNE9_9BACT|nr:metalloregulator ArsR/SmtB family transcription factor [Pseudodesulfovibrio cashew]QGY41762.1 metalloregulator ArsR/SmtB family transcription factor [Pseudodesulfovibrio cashew]
MNKESITAEDAWLAEACKALSHPARVRIFRHLIEEDRCICGRIVEIMPLAQSTVSQHLKVLKDAGLVAGSVEGPKTCYCVDRDALERLCGAIGALLRLSGKEGES